MATCYVYIGAIYAGVSICNEPLRLAGSASLIESLFIIISIAAFDDDDGITLFVVTL